MPNRQNIQLGIKCSIGHSKLEIGDWGLGNMLELVAIDWNRPEYDRVDRNRLEYAGIGVFQPITA